MQKDIGVLSLIIVGAIAYLTAFSLGPPLYAEEKTAPKAQGGAPCPEAGGEEAGGYGAEEAGGYGGEAGGYGAEEAGGYGGEEAAKPCPEEEAGGEAGGYGEEAGGYGSESTELGYL